PEEEENGVAFAKALAGMAEIYVNDAFGTAHRAHASTEGVTRYLPAVAGFLMDKELSALGRALEKPARPFAAVTGGAKVEDKLALLQNIVAKVDILLVGGGMVAAFLKATQSPVAGETASSVMNVIDEARRNKVRLVLAVDALVAKSSNAPETAREVPVEQVPEGWAIVDIGSRTIAGFKSELAKCKTVLWNGPMGIFETPRFARGTEEIARAIAGLKATTIIGGGSTAEAVDKFGLAARMTHVSTGGGASLMFLEGKELPGVAALLDK
ncbi:MAG: phosphoglycerate kinase, partial [Chloroflexi bacterium]|nr:phosphoglycerate kinase [Chloroflexota bacterium]